MKHPAFRTLLAIVIATSVHTATGVAHAADSAPAPMHLGYGDAIQLATREAATVQIAGLRADEAAARVGVARGALLPNVGGAAYAASRMEVLEALGFHLPGQPDRIGPFDVVDARASLTQALIDPASWQRVGSASQSRLQSESDRDASAEGVAQGAALAYLAAARAQALVAARETDLSIAQELSSMAEAQLAAGTAPQIDATRARTQVTSARGDLLLARYQATRSLIDLARALGIDPATPLSLADTLGSGLGAAATRDTTLEHALALRPELKSESARRASASAAKSATAYERLGKLDFNADWGWSGEHTNDALWVRDYQLTYSIPIFDGLRRESRLHEEAAVVHESDVRLHDLHDQVSAEVEQARIGLAAAFDQFDVAIERLSLSQQELDESRDRFVNGVAGNLDVIQAQSSLVRARDAEVDARYFIAVARVALARATGVARQLR